MRAAALTWWVVSLVLLIGTSTEAEPSLTIVWNFVAASCAAILALNINFNKTREDD